MDAGEFSAAVGTAGMKVVDFKHQGHLVKFNAPLVTRAKAGVQSERRSRLRGNDGGRSPDAAFEAHGQQLLSFDRKFHRQLLEHFLAKTVDDQRYRVFRAETALTAIE